MSDLTLTEQKHVRTALQYLRRKLGSFGPIGDALRLSTSTVEKMANGRATITASTVFKLARLLDASVDALLEGRLLPGVCPRCGYSSEFDEEHTVVEDGPRPVPGGGIRLVK